ncbi:MAG: beta-propeller fold lactonase family protein [Cytophagales bacterium]|nr:beta-propeller fold lactonase family protein [Rhizobacter sp.]
MHSNRIKALLAVTQIVMLAAAGPACAGAGKAYVADEGANTVTVLDAASFKKIGRIPVGQGPHNVQVSPDGKWLWVTNNGEPGMAAEKMPAGKMPQGEHAAMGGAGAVWAIDTASNKVVAKVPVGKHPAHVVVSGDGSTAYVTNGTDNTVSVLDTATRRVSDVISVGVSPHGLRISPDGKEAWVANLKAGTVSVIDTASRKQVAEIAVGKGPAQVGFTRDGRFGFVSLSQENQVAVIDPASRKVIRKLAVGTVPIQLYATPDSAFVLVANQGTLKKPGSTVSVIDLAAMKVAATIKTGAGAHGVVIDRDGRHAFVTNTFANTVSVIDIAARRVVSTVPVGKGPNGISVSP